MFKSSGVDNNFVYYANTYPKLAFDSRNIFDIQ